MQKLQDQIRALIAENAASPDALEKALAVVLAHFQSETGTIHSLDRDTQRLHLTAHAGLPPEMVEIVKVIPIGKGIAGQVVARGEPVTICNLQTDKSGVAKPGARQTGVGGALCVPLRRGETMVGTIGVGTVRQYEYTPEETRLLEEIGRVIAAHAVFR